jgi:hypothetical protein
MLKFEGSFGEILSIPIIKIMFDVTSIINNFDNVEVPTATTFRRITSRLKKKCLLDVRDYSLLQSNLNISTKMKWI